MSRAHHRLQRNTWQRRWHRWHRRIGIVASMFVMLLASTGIMLSHAADLRLHERMFDAPWLALLYRLDPVTTPRAAVTTAGNLVWIDGHLYLNGSVITDEFSELIGVSETSEMIAAASSDSLLLLTRDGALLERLDSASLPGPLDAIGLDTRGQIAVRTQGEVLISSDLLSWNPDVGVEIRWHSADQKPNTAVLAPALAAFRGKGISAARLIADLHSGRFLGRIGPWLMDASAIALLLLAGSGLWMWLRQRTHHNRRAHDHHHKRTLPQ